MQEAAAAVGAAGVGEAARIVEVVAAALACSARRASAALEEELAVPVRDLATLTDAAYRAPPAGIQLAVEGLAAGPAAWVVLVAAAASSGREVPLRRRLAGPQGSRIEWISTKGSAKARVLLCFGTHIPVLGPLCQVWMVDPAVAADMLTGPHKHILARLDIHNGWFAGVCVRHPYRYREAVCCAAKGDRQRPAEIEQQIRGSIFVCWARQSQCASRAIYRAVLRVGLRTVDVGAHRERRVLREGLCSVVIGTVDVGVVLQKSKLWIVVFGARTYAGQDTV